MVLVSMKALFDLTISLQFYLTGHPLYFTTQAGRTPRDYYSNTELLGIMQVRQRIQDILERPIPEPKLATSGSHHMYISTGLKAKRVPPPTTIDGKYVAEHLGTALTLALAEIADCRPWDPIEYLGQWLYKYRENRNYIEKVPPLSLSVSLPLSLCLSVCLSLSLSLSASQI